MRPESGASRLPFSHPIWALAALILGLGIGLLIPASGSSAGIPALLEPIGLLWCAAYAVDSLPDIFKTLANITADLAAACIVAARTHPSAP